MCFLYSAKLSLPWVHSVCAQALTLDPVLCVHSSTHLILSYLSRHTANTITATETLVFVWAPAGPGFALDTPWWKAEGWELQGYPLPCRLSPWLSPWDNRCLRSRIQPLVAQGSQLELGAQSKTGRHPASDPPAACPQASKGLSYPGPQTPHYKSRGCVCCFSPGVGCHHKMSSFWKVPSS